MVTRPIYMKSIFENLTPEEIRTFRRLDTPRKIQNFLDALPINFEPYGDTCGSPRMVLRKKTAHCIEGAMLAAAMLYFHGRKPLIMDLKTTIKDFDHVVTLFREGTRWGAISKTNHSILRWREPIYASARELAMSYFHEYFTENGRKTMRSFSKPFDLSRFDKQSWITAKKNVWYISEALDDSPHIPVLTQKQILRLRPADTIEIKATALVEYQRPRRTASAKAKK